MTKVKSKKSIISQSDITLLMNTMKIVFPTVDDVRQIIKDEIKFLPTKNDFFTRMDKLSGEMKAVRESQDLHTGEHQEINDRFEKIDKHLGISTAS